MTTRLAGTTWPIVTLYQFQLQMASLLKMESLCNLAVVGAVGRLWPWFFTSSPLQPQSCLFTLFHVIPALNNKWYQVILVSNCGLAYYLYQFGDQHHLHCNGAHPSSCHTISSGNTCCPLLTDRAIYSKLEYAAPETIHKRLCPRCAIASSHFDNSWKNIKFKSHFLIFSVTVTPKIPYLMHAPPSVVSLLTTVHHCLLKFRGMWAP